MEVVLNLERGIFQKKCQEHFKAIPSEIVIYIYIYTHTHTHILTDIYTHTGRDKSQWQLQLKFQSPE